MNLIEFLDGHDKSMSAMNNVIDMVEYANLKEGDGVISVTEVVEELATVDHYIKELETLFLNNKGATWEIEE
ncbi:hypothetical protein ACQRD4_00910 [Streptococcus hyointestinalis]|uniref:hypothetical protein n=1 Tax=Streptococcus hyointestinalis TaxID=1337 RepID=UPI003D05458B